MADNNYNFGVYGTPISDFLHDVDTSNTVDGKSVYYWINRQDTTVTGDPGCVVLINCTNIVAQGLNLSHNLNGFLLAFTGNSTITKNTLRNNDQAIELISSSNNNISDNDIERSGIAINLAGSSNFNCISRNMIHGQTDGIQLSGSSYNNIFNNSILGLGMMRIRLSAFSNHNCISGNTISNGFFGIYLSQCSDNVIYHNNFVNNRIQTACDTSVNSWDDGYPSGGNYWSDYSGIDFYSGPFQNETGSDGIGDTPYIINAYNRDRYPLMEPYIVPTHDIAVIDVTPSKTVVGQGYSLNINVTVENQGDYTETFNVTAYANATSIKSQTVTLTSGNSTTVTLGWNTAGFVKGNYTIWAYAWPVEGETDTEDNTLTDGWAYVGLIGDVNADGIVDIEDIYLISLAYGSVRANWWYWHPIPCEACPHNPNLDINCDGIIDIEDIYIAALHYGEMDP